MNILQDNFSQIIDMAKSYGLPAFKKRAILREYLQAKLLEIIYQQKESSHIIFVGGTSLRLLRNLNRFSEDLDFDLENKISFNSIDNILKIVVNRLRKENIEVELYQNKKVNKTYYELRFPLILDELKLTKSKEEKLMIKLDFAKFWRGHNKEIALFRRYGFLANIVTAGSADILVEKLFAYLERKETQPRDIYDIVWLLSHQAKISQHFANKNNLPKNLLKKVFKKYEQEKRELNTYKRRLKPFLFQEEDVNKIGLLAEILKLA